MNFFITWILPLIYILLIILLLRKDKKLVSGGFSLSFIILFFLAKCGAGFLANYVSLHFFPNGGDINTMHNDGLELYKLFIQGPSPFWNKLREDFTIGNIDLMNSQSNFVKSVFEGIRLIYFFLDLFSFGNIYTNAVLFNGLSTWIFLRCWIFFIKYLHSTGPGVWLFLMPSAFFFTSTILKEGIAFMLICALLPSALKLYKSFSVLRFVGFTMLLALLFFFKFLIAVTFFAALFFWWLMLVFPAKKKLIIGLSVIISISSFFLLAKINPTLDFPKYLADRQYEFLKLEANSKVSIVVLEPTFISFVKALPTALNNVFFKPLFGEGGKTIYSIFSIEIFSFWGLILFLFAKNKFRINFGGIPPLVWALFLFGTANLIIIGYTIPNIGAITRYRSIFLPFVGLFFWMALSGNDLTRNFNITNQKPSDI